MMMKVEKKFREKDEEIEHKNWLIIIVHSLI
jgi:hypothetical protein